MLCVLLIWGERNFYCIVDPGGKKKIPLSTNLAFLQTSKSKRRNVASCGLRLFSNRKSLKVSLFWSLFKYCIKYIFNEFMEKKEAGKRKKKLLKSV